MKLLVGIAGLVLTGCATVSAQDSLAPAKAAAKPPTEISVATSTLKLKAVPLPATRNLDDKYVRLSLSVPTTASAESVAAERSLLKIASNNLLKFFWDNKQTLTIAAKPIDLRSGTNIPFVQLMRAGSGNGASVTRDLEPIVISPYTTEVDRALALRIQVARANSVDSNVASAAAQAFQLAADLASGGVLARLADKDFSAQSKKLDSAIGALFASGSTEPYLIEMNPYTTEKLDVSAANAGIEQFLFSVRIDVQDTLIGQGSAPFVFPTDPSDITKLKLVAGPSGSGTIRSAMVSATSAINAPNANAITFQEFCATAPGQLAELGLNRFDRAAVMYAYLRNSSWNKNPTLRADSDESDRCMAATSDVVGNSNLTLKARAEIARETQDVRSAWLTQIRNHLWAKSLPIAFQTKEPQNWTAVLSESVSFSVVGKPFKLLSTDEPLMPGGGFTVTKADAAAALAASELVLIKRPFCFSLDPASTAKSFQMTCAQLGGDSANALKIEFTIDPLYEPVGSTVPTISEIRFINN